MEGEYSVSLGGKSVGKVWLQRRGLYYRVLCRCRIPASNICRLIVRNGNTQENLGIPVPDEGEFCLEKMIAMKRIGEENLEFLLLPVKIPVSGTFVPICPEEPFRYLSRLKESYLVERNGRVGVLIP